MGGWGGKETAIAFIIVSEWQYLCARNLTFIETAVFPDPIIIGRWSVQPN